MSTNSKDLILYNFIQKNDNDFDDEKSYRFEVLGYRENVSNSSIMDLPGQWITCGQPLGMHTRRGSVVKTVQNILCRQDKGCAETGSAYQAHKRTGTYEKSVSTDGVNGSVPAPSVT